MNRPLVRRRLYKPDRPPARDLGVFGAGGRGDTRGIMCRYAPVAMPEANAGEVVRAIAAICKTAGVIVGRGCGYESIRDEYTVVGKSRATGKAQDFRVKGEEVATVIRMARLLNGGPMVPGALTAAVH